MPLSWNEIKDQALAFSRKWDDESSEDAEAKASWDDFFYVFSIFRPRVASIVPSPISSISKNGATSI